jgi:hypothetical protein
VAEAAVSGTCPNVTFSTTNPTLTALSLNQPPVLWQSPNSTFAVNFKRKFKLHCLTLLNVRSMSVRVRSLQLVNAKFDSVT